MFTEQRYRLGVAAGSGCGSGKRCLKNDAGRGNEENLKFEELNVDEKILKAIGDMGFEEASPIQAKAIPVVLELYEQKAEA